VDDVEDMDDKDALDEKTESVSASVSLGDSVMVRFLKH